MKVNHEAIVVKCKWDFMGVNEDDSGRKMARAVVEEVHRWEVPDHMKVYLPGCGEEHSMTGIAWCMRHCSTMKGDQVARIWLKTLMPRGWELAYQPSRPREHRKCEVASGP